MYLSPVDYNSCFSHESYDARDLCAINPSGSGLGIEVGVLQIVPWILHTVSRKQSEMRGSKVYHTKYAVSVRLQRQRLLGEDAASEVNSQVAYNRISATVSRLCRGMR